MLPSIYSQFSNYFLLLCGEHSASLSLQTMHELSWHSFLLGPWSPKLLSPSVSSVGSFILLQAYRFLPTPKWIIQIMLQTTVNLYLMGFCILSSSFWVHNHLFPAGLKLQLRAFPWMSQPWEKWHILMILIRNSCFRGYGNGSIGKVLAMYIWGLIPGTYIKEIPSVKCTHVIPAPKTGGFLRPTLQTAGLNQRALGEWPGCLSKTMWAILRKTLEIDLKSPCACSCVCPHV